MLSLYQNLERIPIKGRSKLPPTSSHTALGFPRGDSRPGLYPIVVDAYCLLLVFVEALITGAVSGISNLLSNRRRA